MSVPKRNDVREDGFLFRGYEVRNGRTYEKWMSPAAAARKNAMQTLWQSRKRAKRKANPVHVQIDRDRSRVWEAKARREHPKRFMFNHAKHRAKKRGMEFTICMDDFEIPATCPVFGIPIGRSEGVSSDSSAELDRIDNTLGYVPGNIIVVSRRANRIKNDATISELQRIAEFYQALKAS